jgi:hypothetical protein
MPATFFRNIFMRSGMSETGKGVDNIGLNIHPNAACFCNLCSFKSLLDPGNLTLKVPQSISPGSMRLEENT